MRVGSVNLHCLLIVFPGDDVRTCYEWILDLSENTFGGFLFNKMAWFGPWFGCIFSNEMQDTLDKANVS